MMLQCKFLFYLLCLWDHGGRGVTFVMKIDYWVMGWCISPLCLYHLGFGAPPLWWGNVEDRGEPGSQVHSTAYLLQMASVLLGASPLLLLGCYWVSLQ